MLKAKCSSDLRGEFDEQLATNTLGANLGISASAAIERMTAQVNCFLVCLAARKMASSNSGFDGLEYYDGAHYM